MDWPTDIDDFKRDHSLVAGLASALSAGQLGIVLGAGISTPCLMPEWGELLDRMLANAPDNELKSQLKGKKPLPAKKLAKLVRKTYYDHDYSAYAAAVKKALYQTADLSFGTLSENPTLRALGAIVMRLSQRGTATVMTLNFDDVLETYLRCYGYKVETVHEPVCLTKPVDVRVLHPHGFLPFDEGQEHSKHLVLCESSYLKAASDVRRWFPEWTSYLRSRACIFIGTSGTDDNMAKYVGEATNDHPLSRDHPYWGVSVAVPKKDDVDPELAWKTDRIYCKKFADWDELGPFLINVCQRAAVV